MNIYMPRWLVWLCPVTAILGAVFLAPFLFSSGFWTTFAVAIACSFVPLAIYRLWLSFRRQG